jgi:hypothetical protein
VERPSRAIACLLLGHLLLGAAHVALLPPWEGFDETAHYSYVQQLVDRWELPRVHSARISADVEAYARRGPMPYASAPAEDGLTYRGLFASPADVVARAGALVHGRPETPRRYAPGAGLNYQANHPPLYYLALAPVYLATRQWSWAAHLFSLRLASYLLAWAALVLAVYACATRAGAAPEGGRAAWPWAMLGIALWPALVPSWFPEMARLGNDSLATLVLAGTWLVMVRVSAPAPSTGQALALGALLGAGFLTKLYFVPVAAALLGFGLVRAWRLGGTTGVATAARRLAVVPLAIAGVAGWWYVRNWRDYGVAFGGMEAIQLAGAGGLAAALDQVSPWSAPKGLALFVATLAWPGTWSLARPPSAAIAPMMAIVLLGAVAYVLALRRVSMAAVAWLPAWLAAWVLVAFAYHAVVRAAVTGKGQPGHYLHFLVAAAGAALGLGLATGWPRAAFRWTVAGLAAYAVLFAVALSWAQVMLFAGRLSRLGASNVYRRPDVLPPLLGVPDALGRLGTLAYPAVGAAAWAIGGLLVLAGLGLAWVVARQPKPR